MVDVGVSVHESVLVPDVAARRALLDRVAGAGLDHVTVGDHVSFHGGAGFDGLVAATAALCAHDRLGVLVGVYQLALRHPMVVARQLASVAQLAPGRLVLGVGAGGEDRAEVANCGVDPATRGRRLDESLGLLRQLATGAPVDHKGEFFTLEDAAVVPAPDPAVPLVVGRGSDAALRRAAERGDGWLGMFCSARRFARSRADVIERRAAAGRDGPGWFGLSVWCGLDENGATARTVLGERMQALYRLPPEKFANVTAAGTPEQVADWLAPYVEAGAGSISIVPAARSVEAGVELAGEVRRHLEEKAGIA